MTLRVVDRAAAAIAAALVLSCSDGAAPEDEPLRISGEAAPSMSHGADNGQWHVQCNLELMAQLASGAPGTATWKSGTLRWHQAYTGAPLAVENLDEPGVAAFWSSPTVTPMQLGRASWLVWAAEPFHLTSEFRYEMSAESRERTVTFTTRCEPAAAPLVGRWLLSSIDRVQLPALGINADTLMFFPNVTYTSRGTYGGIPGTVGATGPEPYTILGVTTLELPTAFEGQSGGAAVVQGSTLTLTRGGCCGQAPQVWRFDREGSNPQLPPSPLLLASPSQIVFSATSGGALPPSQAVQLTSSAAGSGLEVANLSWTGSSSSVNGIGASDWLSFQFGHAPATPTSFTFAVYSTNIPAGTYHFTLEITGAGAANLPLIVPVTFNVAP